VVEPEARSEKYTKPSCTNTACEGMASEGDKAACNKRGDDGVKSSLPGPLGSKGTLSRKGGRYLELKVGRRNFGDWGGPGRQTGQIIGKVFSLLKS